MRCDRWTQLCRPDPPTQTEPIPAAQTARPMFPIGFRDHIRTLARPDLDAFCASQCKQETSCDRMGKRLDKKMRTENDMIATSPNQRVGSASPKRPNCCLALPEWQTRARRRRGWRWSLLKNHNLHSLLNLLPLPNLVYLSLGVSQFSPA